MKPMLNQNAKVLADIRPARGSQPVGWARRVIQ